MPSCPTICERGEHCAGEGIDGRRSLPLFLDIREDHEWSRNHLPHAEHLARGILERDIEVRVPDKSTPMILYCGGGYRSILAAESLQKMGYTQVTSMAGGWRAWCQAGFLVET